MRARWFEYRGYSIEVHPAAGEDHLTMWTVFDATGKMIDQHIGEFDLDSGEDRAKERVDELAGPA